MIKKILENNVLLNSKELIMLFNEIFLEAKYQIVIQDALYGSKLLRANISNKIEIDVLASLEDIKKKFKLIPSNIQREFPNKNRYFEIYVKGGLFFDIYYKPFFEKILDSIDYINVLDGDLPSAISFDTNLYFNQFFSQLYPFLLKRYGKAIFPMKFLMSEGVKKELTRYERKYKQDNIDQLKLLVNYPLIVEDFFNQSTLSSRLWHLGHCDFLKCIDNVNYKLVEEDNSIDQNDMDNKIINGLISEIRNQNIKLHLFSQDSDFIARARGNKNLVPKFIDKIPNSKFKYKYSIDWEMFARLIYILAVTFGAIVFEFNDNPIIILQGIWRGKKLNHWENEALKVCSINNVIDKMKKDLNILRSIKLEDGLN